MGESVMISYDSLDAGFIAERFPELRERAEKLADGEFLPHVVFGGVFNDMTISLLKRGDYSENEMLRRIFGMYEELASDGDEDVRDLVQTTLLERSWDEKAAYERAMEMMGERTRELWDCIAEYIAVPR